MLFAMENGFADGLIGHAVVARLLASAVGRPAPSYLLTGAPHLGKRTFAERFARVLLGCAPDDPHWRAHPDLIVLEPEEGKTQISVEQVRELRERISLRPSRAERVVAYVPSADRLNEAGTNALLKVAEEPPAGAVFIFVAEDASRIPGTLKSRSVILPFGIVPLRVIADALVARRFTRKQAEERAEAAHGRPGLAIEPQERQSEPGFGFCKTFLNANNAGERLAQIDALAKACESAEDAVLAWRDALAHAMRDARSMFPDDPHRVTMFGVALLVAVRSVGGALSPRLPLEACAVRLSRDAAQDVKRLFPGHVPSALHPIYYP